MNSGYAVYRPLPSAQHLGLLSAVSSTYVAISYVWGDPTLSRSITINGASLPVTESAFDALMSLRRVDAQVTVWIDAICINQLDLDEKPLQVQFMDRIYACAKQTVVWPGLPADRSDQVMRFADSLDSVALSPEYDRCSVEGAFELGWTTKSHIPDLLAGEGKVISDASKDLVNACTHFYSRILQAGTTSHEHHADPELPYPGAADSFG